MPLTKRPHNHNHWSFTMQSIGTPHPAPHSVVRATYCFTMRDSLCMVRSWEAVRNGLRCCWLQSSRRSVKIIEQSRRVAPHPTNVRMPFDLLMLSCFYTFKSTFVFSQLKILDDDRLSCSRAATPPVFSHHDAGTSAADIGSAAFLREHTTVGVNAFRAGSKRESALRGEPS